MSDRAAILEIALKREASGESWADIVADFHRSGHWGFAVLPAGHPDTKVPDTMEVKRAREVRGFMWTTVQSFIVIKTFVMFFGLNYAIDPTPFYGWGLAISVTISFASLLIFAIRKSRSANRDVFD